MKRVIEIAIAASVVLLVGGCATKKYVAKQTDPIAAKVSEVEKQAQNTQKQLEGDEPKISAAAENRAAAVDRLRIIRVSVIKVLHVGDSFSQPGLSAQPPIEIRRSPPRRLIHAARQGKSDIGAFIERCCRAP